MKNGDLKLSIKMYFVVEANNDDDDVSQHMSRVERFQHGNKFHSQLYKHMKTYFLTP